MELTILAPFDLFAVNHRVAETYGKVRTVLRNAGTTIWFVLCDSSDVSDTRCSRSGKCFRVGLKPAMTADIADTDRIVLNCHGWA